MQKQNIKKIQKKVRRRYSKLYGPNDAYFHKLKSCSRFLFAIYKLIRKGKASWAADLHLSLVGIAV